MILKEWNQIKRLYTAVAKQIRQAIYFPDSFWLKVSAWGTQAGILLSSLMIGGPVFLMGQNVIERSLLPVLPGIGLWVVMVVSGRVVINKTLIRRFKRIYETHELLDYPASTRRLYLRYALFLGALRDHGYGHEAVAKLSHFAEIAKPPAEPVLRLSEYPSVQFFLGACATLFINALVRSPNWEHIGAPILTITLTLVGLLIAAFPLYHQISSRQQFSDLELQRFLQWAERDTGEEEKPPEDMELLC
jgi:hypothetical protein